MKTQRMVLAVFFLSVALLACAGPVSAQNWAPPMQNPWLPPGYQAQSASGKVVNFTAESLTLEVQEAGAAKPVDFAMDANTKVEGKLAKDANVQVTYRVEQGRNVAISVRVLS